MAIDIRATVTCSLGTLISASLSDDYVQGTGLIKCKGSCEISGTITPAPGTVVTFSYTKGGVTRTVPRKLRVLSSFADPFRRTTKVELGCKLTYLSSIAPAPSLDSEPSVVTGKQQQCLNGYMDFSADAPYGIPISAAGVMTTCLSRLEITATSNPLTNVFYRESFDLSAGYVSTLSDLLVSESYCGYLNYDEELVVFSLDQDGGTGPVLDSTKIIDIASIGVGELPADAVVVRYESMQLREDFEDNEDETVLKQRNWEEDLSTTDIPSVVDVRYSVDDEDYSIEYKHLPWSKTVSEYGEDSSWDSNTCIIRGRKSPDLSNTVIRRTGTRNVIRAEAANDYCAQLLSYGFKPGGLHEEIAETIDEYEFDEDGQIVRETKTVKEPFFALAGRLDIPYIFPVYIVDTSNIVRLAYTALHMDSFLFESVIVEQIVTTYEFSHARLPRYLQLDPGETIEKVVNGEKKTTQVYRNWVLTQQGQQAIAAIKNLVNNYSAEYAEDILRSVATKLVLDETQIQTRNDRTLIAVERRPAVELRLAQGNNVRAESEAELLYAIGSSGTQRTVQMSMPYQDDDYYSGAGRIVRGSAAAKAARYGRTQNRLLLGNRSGMNVQAAPENLPRAPFAPFVVQANGLSALYRTNGSVWTMSSDGILASTDALFWGAVGGTGTFWFPVAPGITTLPTTPAVEDTAPSTVLGTVSSVGTNAQTTLNTAFPTATDGQGAFVSETQDFWKYEGTSSTWVNVGSTPGPTATVAAVVPVWNETVKVEGSLRLGLSVTALSYALELQTTAPALSTKLGLTAAQIRKVAVPAAAVTVAAYAPAVQIPVAVRVPAASVAVAAVAPAVAGGAAVIVPLSSIAVEALVPESAGRLKTQVLVPAADLSLAAVAPAVSSGASVAVPAKDVAVAAVVPSNVGAYDPNFTSVSLLLHMDGSNNSTTFTDSSSNGRTITANGNAKVSTAQSQFGGASLLLDGTGDYLSANNTSLFHVVDGNPFTIECWARNSRATGLGALKYLMRYQHTSGYASGGWLLATSSANDSFFFSFGSGSAEVNVALVGSAVPYTQNTWHHVAVTYDGTTYRVFMDGVITRSSVSATTGAAANGSLFIGRDPSNTGRDWDGYIDELRITKGVARYTDAFTPPSVPFPDS